MSGGMLPCYLYTVKPLITDPLKSGQPLYSGQITCPRLILPYISNLREADASQLRTTDTDESQTYLSQTKLPPKADSETTPTNSLYIMRTLVDRFRKIVRHRRWIQRPGTILALLLIVLAFLAMVQQRRGPKM